ncbi:hypothetical protein CULC22_00776 [Corynebacterium ulcerans BR-AD22]|nr:hypothetical protein CULC809_00761 [Corynebacterium ulcerans 809]AEG83489.1 hypothetical protein CULC22_00776 [Corynebacterium ulcerans BR-AD22]
MWHKGTFMGLRKMIENIEEVSHHVPRVAFAFLDG